LASFAVKMIMASPLLGPPTVDPFSLYPAGWVGTRPDHLVKAALAVVDAVGGMGKYDGFALVVP